LPTSRGDRGALPRELFVGAERPDTIAVFAIRPVVADIGGYGGSSPWEITAAADG
jgi:hypothetical protein